METSNLTQLLLVWIAVLLLVLIRGRRRTPGAGLVLAFLLNLWMIHWVGAALYAIPEYYNHDIRIVEAGLEQSLYGVLAFGFASLFLVPMLMNSRLLPHSTVLRHPDDHLPKAYIWTGILFYLLLSTALGRLASATAIISTGQQLIVVGLSLCCWKAWKEGNTGKLAGWLLISLSLPFFTIVTRGFIGYGAIAALSVLVFTSNLVRSRVLVFTVGLCLGYVALSVYVNYMRDRGEIREVVWGGQPLRDRVERVGTTFTTFEWFDASNTEHLKRIDARLNQSFLVGAAVKRLTDIGGFARGETFWQALLALIPRAIWPDKPVMAGSGRLVSDYTGIHFGAGTSVGVGQVMEFYINFGTTGVVCGFLLMGVIVTLLDMQAAQRLANGDLHGFVLWYLPGISFLQVGGSLVEVTSSAAASLVVAFLANKLLDRLQKAQHVLPSRTTAGVHAHVST